MFYLNYQSYTLTCTYGMALAALGQLARGKPPGPPSAYTLTFTCAMALTALSQVARGNRHTHAYSVHMLNPTLGTHVKSQFQCICLIPGLVHMVYPNSGTYILPMA